MMGLALILLTAYLLGSISPSIVLSRLVKGQDIRTVGSGNAGMTNAIRFLGPGWGTLVALIDLGKGLLSSWGLPVWFAPLVFPLNVDPILIRILAGTAAVAGHIWTVFFGFRGGKGVLTLAGAVLGVAPLPVGICFLIFLLIFLLTRYVSLGSIIGAVSFPVIVLVQKWVFLESVSTYLIGFSIFVAFLIAYTHRANIGRLIRGEESKFGKRKPQSV